MGLFSPDRHPRAPHRTVAASAPFGTVVALALLTAGGILSAFSAELKAVARMNGAGVTEALWLCGSAVLGAGILYICRQRAVDRERTHHQGEMMRLADDLQAAVLTMPPPDFIQDFARYYEEAEGLVRRVAQEPDRARREAMTPGTIRCVLRIICQLARRFDDASSRADYSANVMVYLPSESLAEADQQRLGACLRRISSDDVGLNSLRGVLELRNELSVGGGDDAEPNPDLPHGLALPLYRGGPYAESLRPGEHEHRFRVLPGAPVAFEMRTYALVADTLDIQRWCEDNTILDSDDIARLVEFFKSEEGSFFRSFVSISIPDLTVPTDAPRTTAAPEGAVEHAPEAIPVLDPEGRWLLPELREPGATDPTGTFNDREPVAVVNVECTVEHMLRGSDARLQQFVNAITPFKLMLARLLIDAADASELPDTGAEPESSRMSTA